MRHLCESGLRTAHVVGSNNNFETRDLAAANEFFTRDKATIAWLDANFDRAIGDGAQAVVLLIHADMFEFSFIARKERFLPHSGYRNFGEALIDKARTFARPVLLVFGDGHQFGFSRPFAQRAPNIILLIRDTPPVGIYVLNMFCVRGSRLWGSRLHRACVV